MIYVNGKPRPNFWEEVAKLVARGYEIYLPLTGEEAMNITGGGATRKWRRRRGIARWRGWR